MVVQAGGFQRLEPGLVFFIQEVSNLFKDGHRVGLLLGVLANFDQHIEQLVDVGEVEVAGDHKVAGAPVVLAQKGVAIFNVVFAKRSIAQVPQEEFASEGVVVLQGHGVAQILSGEVLETPHDFLEEVLDGTAIHRTHSGDVPFSGVDVQLDVGQPCPVLPAVVLLLHEQVHFVQAVKRRAVLVNVVLKRLLEAQHGDAALVLEKVAHDRRQS